MNPFGVDHEISKASNYKSKEARKHENHAVGNILGGAAGFAGASVTGSRALDHGMDRDFARDDASRANYHAESIKAGVEHQAKTGRISPSQAATKGVEYRRLKQKSAGYASLADDAGRLASKNKKIAIGLGVAGVAGYGNGIRHAFKAESAEQAHRKAQRKAKVSKSAFGVEH